MDADTVINILEQNIRNTISFSFQWISEDAEALGYILSVLHLLGTIAIGMCIILSHTVFPVLWFQIFSFALIFIVWVQHIILKVCVITVAESVFTSSVAPSNRLLSFIYGMIFGNDFNEPLNILVLAETVLVFCLGLELTAKLAEYLYKINGIILG
jgi:hypothetical protein